MTTPTTQLHSEQIVVAAPFSFTGSAQRIWKLNDQLPADGWQHILGVTGIILLAALAWVGVAVWYSMFGLLVVPYRIIRRGQRKRERQALQHRETLALMTEIARREELPR